MSKKRNKKYNPKRTLQVNEWMNKDFIVYAVDTIAMGVLNKHGEPVTVNSLQYDVLQHSLSDRLCYSGIIYKDDTGDIKIDYTVLKLERCFGKDAMEQVNHYADELCDDVGLENVLGKFYFITGDLDWTLEDNFLYNVLNRVGSFDILMTLKEYKKSEAEEQENYMSKFNSKTTQVGGTHYSRLVVQPIEVIKGLRLSWNLANAFKYVARFDHKNQHQDLAKAYDYLARELHDGYDNFYVAKPSIKDLDMDVFYGQFSPKQADILRAIERLHTKRWLRTNANHASQWEETINNIMDSINQLCKEVYGVKAY